MTWEYISTDPDLASANGYDSSLLNGLQSLDVWMSFMQNPDGTWLGFINTLYWIGAASTALVAPWASNHFGRKKTVWVGYVFLLTGTILQSVSPTRALFMTGRTLTGCSMGLMNNAVPSLIAETAYPTHQGVATALYMTSYYVGSIVAAWVTFATREMASDWAWRIPSWCQLVMPALSLPAMVYAPESPRWMVSRGLVDRARATLVATHADSDESASYVDDELHLIQTSLRHEMEAERSAGYADMVRTPGNRHRFFISVTLGFFDQWVGNGILSYYLTIVLETVGISKTRDQLLISACLQIWNLPWAVAGALSVDSFGRRQLFLLSAAVMLASYVILTALYGALTTTGNETLGVAFVPFVFVYFAGYDIAL